jgi:hypothetical protein
MVTKDFYDTIIRKDLVLRTLPCTVNEIPQVEKLEVRIIFPKIIDDFAHLYEGIIYLEELTGQFPVNNILSIKRVGAHDYEKAVVLTCTLRKRRFFNFLLFFSFALIYLWMEMKNVLALSHSVDPQNKIVQLIHKDFFYFFNMPIEYDDRQFQWNLQFLFHFNDTEVSSELLGCFLKYYFFYDLLLLPKSSIESNLDINNDNIEEIEENIYLEKEEENEILE